VRPEQSCTLQPELFALLFYLAILLLVFLLELIHLTLPDCLIQTSHPNGRALKGVTLQ
jgi:hypothetical protein